MKTKVLFLTLTVIFLLACGVSSEQMTATAVMAKAQTQTAAPTLTPTATLTFTPTATPKPTATLEPTATPTPVPAAVGETVTYKGMEITLLEVATHTQIMVSDYYGYDANEGYIFVELAVRVRNRGDRAGSTIWQNVYIVDENDKAWYPFYGGSRTVELERPFNPMAIKLDFVSGLISFKKDTYLRMVWPVHEHHDFLFGIENSPQFTFSVE